ncbi:hypothetical protein T06_8074 [Trichinella sp. T6]|nr:hypothetical protein T06_8074 [Trichinella sp. T6]
MTAKQTVNHLWVNMTRRTTGEYSQSQKGSGVWGNRDEDEFKLPLGP